MMNAHQHVDAIIRGVAPAVSAEIKLFKTEFTEQLFALSARMQALERMVPLKGDKGDPGLDGKDGAPGLDGKDGVPGLDGKDGAPGIDGKDGYWVLTARTERRYARSQWERWGSWADRTAWERRRRR